MRYTADLLLWALVQMPLAFLGEGVSWLDRKLKRAYWGVSRFRHRMTGRVVVEPVPQCVRDACDRAVPTTGVPELRSE